MIKIEVRIKLQVGDVGTEHEYRAELPDSATPEQIAAIGAEAKAQVNAAMPEQPNLAANLQEPVENIAWPKK